MSSAPDSVIITTNNVAPVADAGPDQGGKAPGSPITLNGSGSSDANGDPLTYSWSLTTPPGSAAVLVGATSVIADLYRRSRRQLCRATHCERWHRKQYTR